MWHPVLDNVVMVRVNYRTGFQARDVISRNEKKDSQEESWASFRNHIQVIGSTKSLKKMLKTKDLLIPWYFGLLFYFILRKSQHCCYFMRFLKIAIILFEISLAFEQISPNRGWNCFARIERFTLISHFNPIGKWDPLFEMLQSRTQERVLNWNDETNFQGDWNRKHWA